MKTQTRNISLIAVAAGVAIVPLVRLLVRKWNARRDGETGFNPSPEVTKGLFSAYRGNHLPHRRKPGLENRPSVH